MENSKRPKFVEDLSNYLIGIKNLSKIYVESLTITVEQFLDFINVHKLKNKYDFLDEISLNDIRSLSNSDIYSFIYFLAECHYKTNSRIVKIEHLKTFFEFLHTIKQQIFQEPFKKINAESKKEEKLPKYLSLEEAKIVLNVYAKGEDIIQIRDNVLLHIFLNSGIRLSEMHNLNLEDLVLEDNRWIGYNNLDKKDKDML